MNGTAEILVTLDPGVATYVFVDGPRVVCLAVWRLHIAVEPVESPL